MADQRLISFADSQFGGSSKGSSWRERRQKRDQDYRYEEHGEQVDSGEGSSQLYRSTSYIPEHEQYDRRDQELECLHKQVRDLKLEVRGRHWRGIVVNPLKILAAREKVGGSSLTKVLQPIKREIV